MGDCGHVSQIFTELLKYFEFCSEKTNIFKIVICILQGRLIRLCPMWRTTLGFYGCSYIPSLCCSVQFYHLPKIKYYIFPPWIFLIHLQKVCHWIIIVWPFQRQRMTPHPRGSYLRLFSFVKEKKNVFSLLDEKAWGRCKLLQNRIIVFLFN